MKNKLTLTTLLCFFLSTGIRAQFLDVEFRDQSVTMQLVHSGKQLFAYDEDDSNNDIFQFDAGAGDEQVFQIQSTEDNIWYRIYHPLSGKYVTVIDATDLGTVAMRYEGQAPAENQEFKFVEQTFDDRFKIHSRFNQGGVALVLEIPQGEVGNFVHIHLKRNNLGLNDDNQKFDLANVSGTAFSSRAQLNHTSIVGKEFHIQSKSTTALLGEVNGEIQQLPAPDFGANGTFFIEDSSDDGQWWTPDKRWFFISSVSDGRYLTVSNNAPGTVVELDTLYDLLDNPEQQFRLIGAPAGSGWYKLRSRMGNLVLELRPDGTLVVDSPVAGTAPNQKFAFNLNLPDTPERIYAVVGKQTGDFLTDQGILGNINDQIPIKRIRQANPSVHWQFQDMGNGFFRIQNELTKQYLVAIDNPEPRFKFMAVHPESDLANTDQALWSLEPVNDNFRIRSKYFTDNFPLSNNYIGTPPLSKDIVPQTFGQDNAKWLLLPVITPQLVGTEGDMDFIADSELPDGCFAGFGLNFQQGLAERVGLPAEPMYFPFISDALSYAYGMEGTELSEFMQRIKLNNIDHRAQLAFAVRVYITDYLAFQPVATWSPSDVASVQYYEQAIQNQRADYAGRLDNALSDFLQQAAPGQTPSFFELFGFGIGDAADFQWPSIFGTPNQLQEEHLARLIVAGANAGHENRLLSIDGSRAIGYASSIAIGVGIKYASVAAALKVTAVLEAKLAATTGGELAAIAAKGASVGVLQKVSAVLSSISGSFLPVTIAVFSTQMLVEQVIGTIEVIQLEDDIQEAINLSLEPVDVHVIMTGNNLLKKMKLLDDLDFVIGVPANNVTQLGQSTFNGYLFTNNDNVYQPAFDDPVCKNITVDLDAQTGSVSISPEDVRADNLLILPICGGPVQWSLSRNTFNCNDLGPQTVSLTLSNSKRSASCQATVTVRDETLPNANCKNLSIILNTNGYSGIDPEDIDNNSWDNCSITLRTTNRSDFGCADVGENTVTLTVEDGSGNTNSCTSTVTVIDNIPPSATCQGLTVQLNAAGSASITPLQVDNGSADACLPLSLSLDQQDFDCTHVGNNTVTLTVTDNNGNSRQCQANITVEDNVAPVALCRNITAGLDANGQASITPQQVDDGSSDACGITSLSLNTSGFLCTDRGPNTVELTVTDINGNSSNCIATVNVADNIAPTIKCYNPTVAIEPDGDFELTLADVYDAAQSFDNCGITQVLFDPVTYTCDEAGMTFNVPVSIQDAAGNISSCNANVQVVIGTALPPQWTATDIGSQGSGSNYTFDPCTSENPALGTFSVSTGGYNLMPFNSDNLAFIGRELCNNGGIQAKIEHIEGGFAGLMIRESSELGSKMTAVFSNNTSMLRWETRYNTNGDKSAIVLFRPFPYWLRLVRQGNWIRGFYSTTGNNWQLAHQVYLPMADCVEMGLAVFTTDPNGQADAQFSNVQSQSGVGGGSLVTPAPASSSASTSAHQRADVFPNPSTGAFTLTFEQPLQSNGVFILRNELGQQVSSLPLQSGTTHTVVRNDNLPTGLYFGAVKTEDGYREVLKILRQ